MDEAILCPFKVGQRIHELANGAIFHDIQDGDNRMVMRPTLDPMRPDATVTAITDKGFTYQYTHPLPFGRAAWGQMMTGGECYPEGYQYWVGVD